MSWFHLSPKYCLGLVFIVLVAVIWSGASILVQYIFDSLDFQSPFLVTYICNGLFVIYLPLWQIWVSTGLIENPPKYFRERSADEKSDELSSPSTHQGLINGLTKSTDVSTDADIEKDSSSVSKKCNYTHEDVFRIALIISPFWFVSNCLYNYSLLLTSISSSTIISNLSAAFTLTFAYFWGLEGITFSKIAGIVFCFAGAVVVTVEDSDNSNNQSIGGDIVALFASMGYGLYTTIIRKLIPDDESISMQLLFGYIGLINSVLALPALIIMGVLNLESIATVSGTILGFIFLNGFCDNVISDYLWARAVILTSPTVATLGMSITIPLAIVSDIALGNSTLTLNSALGAVFVLIGIFCVNVDNEVWVNIGMKLGIIPFANKHLPISCTTDEPES